MQNNTPARVKLVRNIEELDRDGAAVGQVRLDGQASSTGEPGIYEARLAQLSGPFERRMFALNVDPRESDLELAALDRLTEVTAGTGTRLLDADEFAMAARDDERFSWSQILLFVLIGLLLLEQLLAYSTSYHPSSVSSAAANTGRTWPKRGALQ